MKSKIVALLVMMCMSGLAFADGHNEHAPPKGAGSGHHDGGCGCPCGHGHHHHNKHAPRGPWDREHH